MGNKFRVQGYQGNSFLTFNPIMETTVIPLTINGDIDYLDNPLEVKLTSKASLVAVDGVFRLEFGGIAFDSDQTIVITIYFYKDDAKTQWAYYTVEELSGINLTASEFVNFSIPIKFLDKPLLSSTNDIAKYYIGIYTEASIVPTGATFNLSQYCVEGREIEGLEFGGSCNG